MLEILPLEEPADRRYGELRVHLERQGTPIGPNDMLIAAHALAVGLTVVTDSVRVFSRVPGLHVENWLAPLRPHAGSPIAASRGPSLSVHHSVVRCLPTGSSHDGSCGTHNGRLFTNRPIPASRRCVVRTLRKRRAA